MWNPSIVRTNRKWFGKRNFCCIYVYCRQCSTFLSHWTQCTWTFLAKQKKTQQNKWNTEIVIISGQFSIELWQNRIRKLVHAILPTDFHFNVNCTQCMERVCVCVCAECDEKSVDGKYNALLFSLTTLYCRNFANESCCTIVVVAAVAAASVDSIIVRVDASQFTT